MTKLISFTQSNKICINVTKLTSHVVVLGKERELWSGRSEVSFTEIVFHGRTSVVSSQSLVVVLVVDNGDPPGFGTCLSKNKCL